MPVQGWVRTEKFGNKKLAPHKIYTKEPKDI